MKKITAIILSLIFALSIINCKAVVANAVTDDISFEEIKSLEDFANQLEENGYKITETEYDDGTVVVNLEAPTTTLSAKKIKNQTGIVPNLTRAADPNSKESTLTGDVNGDGKINNKDLALLMQYINKWEVTLNLLAADLNNDGKINNKDYASLMQQINGWSPTYTYVTGQTHTKLHYSERYLYSTLNAEQKEWYKKIDTAINNLEERVQLDAKVGEDRNYYIYYMYMFDNPEHFYLSTSITLYNSSSSVEIGIGYAVGNAAGEYTGYNAPLTEELKQKILTKKAVFEEEANRILSTIPANAPAIWKEKLIYDRILMDSFYNLGAQWDGRAEDNWTAYGIMVNKYGVCESYSEAFQTLCLYAGVKCTGVIGTAGGGHKWNAVELDGEWYMCDITFDDPIGGEKGAAYHYYFNRTSEWFEQNNHDWSDCEYDVPECNGTQYDFDKYFGGSRWE